MDSAGQDLVGQTVGQVLAAQEAALARHEQMLMQLRNEIARLMQAIARLTPLENNPPPGNSQPANPAPRDSPAPAAVASSSPVSTPSPEVSLPTPEPFSGQSDKCAGLVLPCLP